MKDENKLMSVYLVIGGAGFIGSHLVEALAQHGHQVRVLDNLSFGDRENLPRTAPKIQFLEGDASDPTAVASVLDGVDGVFHLASTSSVQLSMEDPIRNQRSGEAATLVILDQCRKARIKRLVFSSSAAVYGDFPESPKHEQAPLQPRSPYAVSKVAGELYCKLFAMSGGPDTASLRYFNVFGPRQRPSSPYSGVISIFLDCLRRKTAPTIYGDGRQTRDFISVHDVVHANVLAMENTAPLQGECFNVATGRSIAILEVWKQLCDIANIRLEPQLVETRPGDIRNSSASIEKIRKALGFHPMKRYSDALRELAESVLGATQTQ